MPFAQSNGRFSALLQPFGLAKLNGRDGLWIQPVDATHFYGALEVKPLGGLFLSSVVSI